MQFIDAALESYLLRHSQEEPELLRELSRETHLKVLQPRMITGHYQGRFLSLLSKIHRPKYLLEIGTYTGYAALCLAEGMQKNGELHTIDINEELEEIQKKYFGLSEFGQGIIRHTGDAMDIIPKIDRTFDFVYIDAEKREYLSYLELVLPKTRPGSLILSDNVLWSGKVLYPPKKGDIATEMLLEYNMRLREDKRLESVMLPIRDGLTLSRVL